MLCVLFFIFFVQSLFSVGIGGGIDLAAVDSFFLSSKGARIEFWVQMMDDLRLSVPFGMYRRSDQTVELSVFEFGAAVDFYPFPHIPFYTGLSLVRVGYLWGLDAPLNPYAHLMDIRIGYTFRIGPAVIEPRVTITEKSLSASAEAETLMTHISQCGEYRFSLLCGVEFNLGGKE